MTCHHGAKNAGPKSQLTSQLTDTMDPFDPDALEEDIASLADLTGLSLKSAGRLLNVHGGIIERAAAAFFEESDAEPEAQNLSESDETEPLRAVGEPPVTDVAYRPVATGETFRRRALVGVDAEEQLIVDEHRPHHLVDWKSRAGAGEWPITLEIHNRSASVCEVCWIDWQAAPQQFGALPPGGTFRQETHAEHAWLVRSVGVGGGGARGEPRTLLVYMAKRTDQLEHALTIAAAGPAPSVLERVAEGDAADGAGGGARGVLRGVLRFLRLLLSTEGAILVGLVAVLVWFKRTG